MNQGRLADIVADPKGLSWDKVEHFIDFAPMRSILLKRGRWHMLRLYTPEEETHALVVSYLAARLRKAEA